VVRPAIPAAPPIRRAPVARICVISALVLAGAIVGIGAIVNAVAGDPVCGSACTVGVVAILVLPFAVAIGSASLIARVTWRIAMPARIWLSYAVGVGLVGAILIGSVTEGNDEPSALLLIPVAALFVAPFVFIVVSVVSWVYEARGAGRRRAPARPDPSDWG
jgi:hypothetical protein